MGSTCECVCQAVLQMVLTFWCVSTMQLLFELADKLADELSRLLFIIHEGVAAQLSIFTREFGSILKCKSAPRNYLIWSASGAEKCNLLSPGSSSSLFLPPPPFSAPLFFASLDNPILEVWILINLLLSRAEIADALFFALYLALYTL